MLQGNPRFYIKWEGWVGGGMFPFPSPQVVDATEVKGSACTAAGEKNMLSCRSTF